MNIKNSTLYFALRIIKSGLFWRKTIANHQSMVLYYPNESTTPLALIAESEGTDKGGLLIDGTPIHSYTDFYQMFLGHRRYEVNNVLEFGIGSNDINIPSNMGQKGTPGASLRMWAKFFPNASIQGVDIDSKILFSEERITTGLVDQLNRSSIQNFLKTQGKTYDLIIDDGLHSKDSIINTIEESIPFLAPEGYLIVEDVDNNLIIELLKCAAGIPDVTGFFVLFRETTGRTRTGYLYVLQHKPSLIETQLGSEHR